VPHHEFFLEEEEPVLSLLGMRRYVEFFVEAQIIFLKFPADQLFS
jgi:hypothetical protein